MFFRGSILSLLLLASFVSNAQYVFNKVDIWPGPGKGFPLHLKACNNQLFFQANDSVHGTEPWVSDGTVSGTHMIKDIVPGTAGSYPDGFMEYNGKTYFQATDGINGTELWVSDGTDSGTHMVADINPGAPSSNPQGFIVAGGLLYFGALEATTGYELWVTDGTVAGTHITKDIAPGKTSATSLSVAVEYKGQLYFVATDGTNGKELYTTDGTSTGTKRIVDLLPGSGGGVQSSHLFVYNGLVYFGGTNGSVSEGGSELYVSDGTAGGTRLLKDLAPNWESKPDNFVLMNGKLYFDAQTGDPGNTSITSNKELWVSDGTAAGTQLVKDIWPGHKGSMTHPDFPISTTNNKLFFPANDSVHGTELWASDGTTAGTYMVKDITKGLGNGTDILLPSCATFGNKFFFDGGIDSFINTTGYLYVTDGTDTGTHLIRPSWSTNGWRPLYNSLPNPYVVLGNKMFFPANFDSSGFELWWIGDTSKLIPPPIKISQLKKIGFSIAPNPASGNVYVSLNQVVVNGIITVTDLTGRKVLQQDIQKSDKNITLHLSNIPKGTYIVTLRHNDGIESKKLLLE